MRLRYTWHPSLIFRENRIAFCTYSEVRELVLLSYDKLPVTKNICLTRIGLMLATHRSDRIIIFYGLSQAKLMLLPDTVVINESQSESTCVHGKCNSTSC